MHTLKSSSSPWATEMDSHQQNRRNNRRSKAVLLFLIVSLPTILFSSLSTVAVASNEKVKLTVYYEALCPSCEDFIINHLYKIVDNGLISIVELKLSPYGNARISSNGTIVCQHGEWECLLNTVEACVIHVWPALSLLYQNDLDTDPALYILHQQSCFEILNLDPKPVAGCYSSGLGYKLEVGYADETMALDPPHEYVPWVVVDGQPLYDDYTNFISYICKAYKGSNVPQACLGLSHSITAPKDSVCYKDEDDLKSKPISTLSEIISSMVDSWITMLA